MSVHVAILWPQYLKKILSGEKTIESRLTKTNRAPYGQIAAGDRIFFKASSGPYMATAIAGEAVCIEGLNPKRIRELKAQYNSGVCGDADYWRTKEHSRYATFIELDQVVPIDTGPAMRPSGGIAWFVLPDETPPVVFSVTLTDGAIRNRYVRVPKRIHEFPRACYGGKTISQSGKPVTFELQGGERIESDLLGSGMIRNRRWAAFFEANNVKADDTLLFVQKSPRCFEVKAVAGKAT